MKVAVIGRGFAGLACTHKLLVEGAHVTVYDPAPIHASASAQAAGLLNPFHGLRTSITDEDRENAQAALKLIRAVGEHVILSQGIVRVAALPRQQKVFRKLTERYPDDVEWWDSSRCREDLPGIHTCEGIFIKDAYAIDCAAYVQGLWNLCEELGAVLVPEAVHDLDTLHGFDAIIVAAGYEVKQIQQLASVPLEPLKGQLLNLHWPDSLPSLPHAVTTTGYLVMNQQTRTCVAGSTFEKEFGSDAPDLERAREDIFARLRAAYPQLPEWNLIDVRSGIRATTALHQPIVGQMSERCWILAGLGSKGLLKHASLAELLVDAITSFLERPSPE